MRSLVEEERTMMAAGSSWNARGGSSRSSEYWHFSTAINQDVCKVIERGPQVGEHVGNFRHGAGSKSAYCLCHEPYTRYLFPLTGSTP